MSPPTPPNTPPVRPRTGYAREDQRHTVRVVVRITRALLARLDAARGAVTRSAWVAALLDRTGK